MLAVQVLLRALRDFNLGKLTADDTGIFMGLLNDLFPKTVELVPRAIDREFEPKASVSEATVAAAATCTTTTHQQSSDDSRITASINSVHFLAISQLGSVVLVREEMALSCLS